MSFLPGMFPGGAAAARALLTTLTQVGSAISSAGTITAPATVEAGDLLVLWQRAVNTSGLPTLVEPSGFVTISNTTHGTNVRFNFCYKIADGSEDGATLTGMDGTLADGKALYQFRGDIPITSVTIRDLETQSTDGNPTAHTVGASAGVVPLIVMAGYDSGGAVDPRSFSPAKDGEVNNSTSHYLAFKIYNSSPSDVTVDMDDEGNNNCLHTFYIECA